MLNHIKLATPEQVNAIKDNSDLMPGGTQVLELDGTIAVIRTPVEVNPVHWAKDINDVKRGKFIWGLEERLLGAGIDRYYVQIDAKDERWQKVIKGWGFEQVSPIPELRFLRVIHGNND